MKERLKPIYLQGKSISVTDEVYSAVQRPVWRTFKFAQRHHECSSPNWRYCQGDCGLCQFRVSGDHVSIDELKDAYDLEFASVGNDQAEVVVNSLYIEHILKLMDMLDPNGRLIGEHIMSGKPDRAMADSLNIPTSTFSDRKLRLLRKTRELLLRK